MKTAISLTRILILIALGITGIYLIFCGVLDTNENWLRDLLLSKTFGIAALYVFYRLYTQWSATDKWISAYDKWADQESQDTELE